MNTFFRSTANLVSTEFRKLLKYEAHKMCQSGVIEERFASKFVISKCKIQEICKRTVETYQLLLDFVSNEYMTQVMRDKNCLRGAIYIEICL